MTKQLPIVNYKNKRWFLDERLKQLRNINNPHDYIDLTDKQLITLMAQPKRWCVNCRYASNFQCGPSPSGKFDGCDCLNIKAIDRIYPDEKPSLQLGKDIFRGEVVVGKDFSCPEFKKATKKQLKERAEVFEYDKKQLEKEAIKIVENADQETFWRIIKEVCNESCLVETIEENMLRWKTQEIEAFIKKFSK